MKHIYETCKISSKSLIPCCVWSSCSAYEPKTLYFCLHTQKKRESWEMEELSRRSETHTPGGWLMWIWMKHNQVFHAGTRNNTRKWADSFFEFWVCWDWTYNVCKIKLSVVAQILSNCWSKNYGQNIPWRLFLNPHGKLRPLPWHVSSAWVFLKHERAEQPVTQSSHGLN